MRRNDGEFIFAILQPVEAIEMIHQLAASVGCHIHVYPRKDFASWRGWKINEQPLLQNQNFNSPGSSHPPLAELLDHSIATSLPPPEEQPGLKKEIQENISVRAKRKKLQMLQEAKNLASEKTEQSLITAKTHSKSKKEEIKKSG
jgi:hypothetical protein